MSDIKFLQWYEGKCFKMLEQMKPEFHREYYCRTAWFQRDNEVEQLQRTIEKLEKEKDELLKCLLEIRRSSIDHLAINNADNCIKRLGYK